MEFEELHEKFKNPETQEEKDFKERAYKIGMKNGWCSGEYDRQDGGFIVEEDRLNENSFSVAHDINTLKEFFKCGNWCLGQGIIFKNLCFINQINGGDEWLTIKNFEDEAINFESISFERMIERNKGEFEDVINRLLKADKTACKKLEY